MFSFGEGTLMGSSFTGVEGGAIDVCGSESTSAGLVEIDGSVSVVVEMDDE